MTALTVALPTQRQADTTNSCPSWCTETVHYDDRYHAANVASVSLDTTRKGVRQTFEVSMGGMPGEQPTILVTTTGFDGFQGSPDEIEAFGEVLLEAASLATAEAEHAPSEVVAPEHCARLSEGEDAAADVAELLEPIVGHPVEICTDADDDHDVALLLYPSDVRALLKLAGVEVQR